jgi:Cdc6-like AAA superfamily ATPase
MKLQTNMFTLKPFSPGDAPGMHCIAIIGSRAVGKTILVKDLLRHLDCQSVTMINPSESVKGEYDGIINDYVMWYKALNE